MKLSMRSLVYASAGALALILALLLLIWMWEPPTDTGTKQPKDVTLAKAAPPRIQKELVVVPPMLEERKPADVLERLNIDPAVTPHCAIINQWHDRNVPMWVILDNMGAQAMRFDLVELECLTASPVPPGILTFAENNEKAPQKR